MMSLGEWEAELKCSATGKPGELFRTLRRCSLKRSPCHAIWQLSKKLEGVFA